jgi:PAS domain S-box-containing protein
MIAENPLYTLLILLGAILVALVADLIRRRNAEDSLKDRVHILTTLADSIPSPIFYKDCEGIYQGCNTAFLNMLGRTREEVVGKSVYDISPKHLAEVYEKADNDLLRKGGVQRYETQVKFADGSNHEMFFTKSVFHDEKGEVAGLLGVMLDITERKKAEEKLRLAHETLERKVEERTHELEEAEKESRTKSDFLNTVINSINHGIVVIDAKDHTIKLANKAASGGQSTEGIHCFELLHNRGTPCVEDVGMCPMHQVTKTGEPCTTMHNHTSPGGEPHFVEIHTYPVFDENGEVVQIIDNIMDVTSRRLAEKALLDAKNLAESTNQHMSEFLDTVSHELRTPMTSVQGFSKLIQKSFSDRFTPITSENATLHKAAERIEQNLAIVISESERMVSLINDQLDLSKLQSGRIDWKMASLAPAELIERTLKAVTPLFSDDDITLISEVEEGLPMLTGDPDRLMQVLINLISNAAKFTQEGTVRCKVTREGEGVLFAVSDTGIGIPGDQIDHIFSKFKQVQNDITGKPAGTGLGLPISKEIVQHHGGRIWAESVFGEGSTFYVSLPAEETKPPEGADAP